MGQDSHLRSGCRLKANCCEIGGPGPQYTQPANLVMVRRKSPNPSELSGLSTGHPAGPSVDSYNALVFAV